MEGYEGLIVTDHAGHDTNAVLSFLHTLLRLCDAVDAERLFAAPEQIIVSAGGSAYYDLVAHVLSGASLGIVPILRSGCYASHDSAFYERVSPLAGPDVDGSLRAALTHVRVRSRDSSVGAFARSDPAQPTPDIEWHVQPLSLDKFGDPLHSFPAITPSVCNLRPTSRGWVRIQSPDPADHPQIRLNYLSTEEDRRVAVEGMRFTRRIMGASAMAKYQPEEYRPGIAVQDEKSLEKAAGELGTTIFHPVGSCRMGRDPMAVVDDQLRVRGIERLRIIDASVFPRITSGNTNAPTYVVAEKGARAILKLAAPAPI